MAASNRVSVGGTKRKSAIERLADLDGVDLDAPEAESFFLEKPQMEAEEEESISFRHHAPRSQKRQDRILEGYYHFVKSWYKDEFKQTPPPTQEVLDERAFPSDVDKNGHHRQLARMLNMFMTLVIKTSVPRALRDRVVGYSCMIGYRKALLFWVTYKFRVRNLPSPMRGPYLWNAMVQNMRKIAHDTQMRLLRTPKDKTHLGLSELMQLIDMDTRGTANIALAEGHHLAWCIARCCALRPSAIGRPPKKDRDPEIHLPFMTFGDFAVKRSTAGAGQFDVELTVRNLKLKPQDVAEGTGYHSKTVTFNIRSPQNQHNLMMSVGHRFLVLALRRGALEDYSTIDELLNGDQLYIRVKKEFLNRPVIVSGTPRGLNILIDEPVSTAQLTSYLSLRGKRAGYSDDIEFYSIRRRAGTDFAQVLGVDGARRLMCHDPDSRTLEKFYLDMLSTADVSALGLGEDHRGREKQMQLETGRLALTKLPKEVVVTFGREVNALVRQTVIFDEIYQECTTNKARRNRERVLRRLALAEFMNQAHEEQKAKLTLSDFKGRSDALMRKATNFNKRLLERIRTSSKTPASSQESQNSMGLDEDEELGTEEFEEAPDEEPAEDIQEDLAAHGAEVTAVEEQLYSEDMADYVNLLDEEPYVDAVRAVMELLMENGLSEYRAQIATQCPLCLDDTTIRDPVIKHRMWEPGRIRRHMLGRIHAPVNVLIREATNKQEDDNAEKAECQFCAEIAPEDDTPIPSYPAAKELIRHWRHSNANRISGAGAWSTRELAELHEGLKAAAGFFEPGFYGDTSDTSIQKHEKFLKDSLDIRKIGDTEPAFRYSKDKALATAMPFPGRRRLFIGMFPSTPKGFLEMGSMVPKPTPSMLDLRHRKRIDSTLLRTATYGRIPGAERLEAKQIPQIDPEDAHLIKVVPVPGTAGNLVGQGNRIRDQLDGVRFQSKETTEDRLTVPGKHSRGQFDDGRSGQKKVKRK